MGWVERRSGCEGHFQSRIRKLPLISKVKLKGAPSRPISARLQRKGAFREDPQRAASSTRTQRGGAAVPPAVRHGARRLNAPKISWAPFCLSVRICGAARNGGRPAFTSLASRWWHRGMGGPQMIVDHARAGDLTVPREGGGTPTSSRTQQDFYFFYALGVFAHLSSYIQSPFRFPTHCHDCFGGARARRPILSSCGSCRRRP